MKKNYAFFLSPQALARFFKFRFVALYSLIICNILLNSSLLFAKGYPSNVISDDKPIKNLLMDPFIRVIQNPDTPQADTTELSLFEFDSFFLCVNQEIRLEAVVESNESLTYAWQNLSGQVFSTDSIFTGTLGSDFYTIVVRNSTGLVVSSLQIQFQICALNTPPTNARIQSTGSTSLCTTGPTQVLTLIAEADNPSSCIDAELTYQWFKDGNILTSETNQTLQITNSSGSEGDYSVIVSNVCGGSIAVSITINTVSVIPSNVAIITEDNSSFICTGGTLKLMASADDADSYRWFRNSDPIPVGTGSSLDISTAGTYRLEASNGCGTISSSILISNLAPPSNFTIFTVPSSVLCDDDDEVTFGVSISGFADRYELYKDGELFATNTTPSFTSDQVGTYHVLAFNKCGFSTSNTMEITRISSPTNTSIQLEGTASPSLSPTCTPPTDSITFLAVSDGQNLAYEWFFSEDGINFSLEVNVDTFIIGTDTIKVFSPKTDSFLVVKELGFYYVRVSNACNFDSSAVVRVVEAGDIDGQAITLNAVGGTKSCVGSIELQTTNLGDGVSYVWTRLEDGDVTTTVINQLFATKSGTYTVQGFNACGATLLSDPVVLDIELTPEDPEIVLSNLNTIVCVENGNEQRVLRAQVDGSNLSLQWFRDGMAFSTDSIITLSAANQTDLSGTYFFTATNSCGSISSGPVTIEFIAPPIVDEINLLVDACSNLDTVSLSVQTSASDPLFTWFRNNAEITTTTDPFLDITTNGTYRVQVSNVCVPLGVSSQDVEIEVGKSLPIPEITSTDRPGINVICPGEQLTLKAEVPSGFFNDLSYRWFRGNQAIVGADQSELIVDQSGVYRAEVFSLSDFTCTSLSLPYNVFVRPKPTLLLTFSGNLSICEGDSVLLKANSTNQPEAFQWLRDGQAFSNADSIWVSVAGNYQVETIYTQNTVEFPCDFTNNQSVDVITFKQPRPEIEQKGNLLKVLVLEDHSYFQWNRDGVPLVEATDSVYLPLDAGNYSVTTGNELGCEGTSDEIFHPGTFLNETEDVRISPNPNDGNFQIVIVSEEASNISIYNSIGQLILQETSIPRANSISGFAEVTISALAPGMYFVRSLVDGNFVTRKIVVEK